ncbi:homeobox-leucine zipper ATHB-40-like [Olea europaea subsp. europaea]|uniref:Homeobox-leucine zipper protein n=1 Tax=Olea europaea subsp. europaea TaxID=158383 RepID=A0A8S0SPW6_OLEEU|nr:homeobox-leucine zipper ATHB-40-like [Olea europaea subsp. europaea]CAA2993667.1 homeobox-leucine zipper ATHB-40-like [Olea europaea subsp. europaea]
MLEMSFGKEQKLKSERKEKIAFELRLDPRQASSVEEQVLEEEYSKLKAEHDCTEVEKCRLENEVLTLKGQICEAEKEIQRTLERGDGFSSISSPSSSFSMELLDPTFLGGFGMED